MRRTFLLVLACSVVLLSPPGTTGGVRAEENKTRIAPVSGGAEVESIRIERFSAQGADTTVHGTGMSLELWFPAVWKSKDVDIRRTPPGPHRLIRIKSLDPIEDDTGKLLLTERCREQIHCLRDEVRNTGSKEFREQAGPVLTLPLEAPARRAETIKSIKGKAEVSLAKEVRLTFDDLDAVNGKVLEHSDYPALKDMKLKFALKPGFLWWTAEMSAPFKFPSPRDCGRLDSWDVFDRGWRVTYTRESGMEPEYKGGVTVFRTFNGGKLKGLSLRLVVVEPVETVTFDFDFQNVPLP